MVEMTKKYKIGTRRFGLINWVGAWTLYKKERGMITKLVTEAIWSNFSAHKPAMIPIFPKIKDDKKVNAIKVI